MEPKLRILRFVVHVQRQLQLALAPLVVTYQGHQRRDVMVEVLQGLSLAPHVTSALMD
jgi:hypothetical protein